MNRTQTTFASALLALTATQVLAQMPPHEADRDTRPDTWAATDGLGRRIDPANYPAARKDRFVGVFYFLWMQGGPKDKVFDITRLLAANSNRPAWGPESAFHWWGEPYFSYYRSDDAWVIAKHAQMLADAGVDVVFFDVTNAVTYDETLATVCETFEAVRARGGRTPQIAFITHAKSAKTIGHLYDTLYKPGLHKDLWFRWQGKPLLLGESAGLEANAKRFFTLRESWAWSSPEGWFKDGHDKWPWLDNTPQKYGWHDSPDKPEEISAAVAQHPVTPIGRSYHDGKQPPAPDARPEQGLYFAEQWKRALKVDPQFVFVTGWNEWIAQRTLVKPTGTPKRVGYEQLQPGGTFFVDTYSEEFSRDIEPMRGGHGDAYYYQMVEGIRRYKGVGPLPAASKPKTVQIAGDFDQWQDVTPNYLDDLSDTGHRDAKGYGDAGRLTNNTGRNDLDLARVTYDATKVYFYVRTREPLTRPQGFNWMTLLVRTTGRGWAGYDLAINRTAPKEGKTAIEKSADGRQWTSLGQADIRYAGNELQLSIPRDLIKSTGPVRFEFKWTDNGPIGQDPIAFIDQGDAAPNGRFNYRYDTGR